MGFFLTSKKASATLIFLVISVLVISSGVIITNELKKPNSDNVAGTGLVSLDTEQDTSQDSGSSDDQITFTFGDSERKTSSKKSSSGGGGGSSSKATQTYDEPEILDDDEVVENQTPENQTEINDTEESNESEIDDFINSSRQIFSRNGTRYIMRDGEEYLLSISSSSDQYIQFNPSLPSSVCENEQIYVTVKGYGSYSPTAAELANCAFNQYLDIGWCVKLMEDDLFGDEEIVKLCGTSRAYASIDYPFCNRFYFETSISVQLSFWIINDPGGSGEFYAKLEDGYGNEGIVQQMSTPSYNVYGYVNGECDCLSGPCCDLSSRPYEYKSYGTQPTGYNDYYTCSGTNSPTSTSYCIRINYYCDGNSEGSYFTSSSVDTCGICEYCTTGDSTCNYYSSSYSCGTKDCDYLNTACRNYHDVNKYCSSGSCISPSCTSYTNANEGTSCGTNKECDGSGTCVTCTSHEYYSCYDNDVYWYDACDNREEKKLPDCGISDCSSWTNFCKDDELWKKRLCVERGCSGNSCFGNWWWDEQKIETCQYGCENGQCQSNPIECTQDSDCPSDHYMGDAFCFEGNVSKLYRDYFCAQNPETSYCAYIEQNKIIEYCSDYCEDWGSNYCNLDDVYHNKTCHDKDCSEGACFNNNTYIEEEKVQECGAEGCSEGECVYVECYDDDWCDDDYYTGSPFCQGEDVWQDQVIHICNNPGEGDSYCSGSIGSNLKESCGSDYCESWQYDYCKLDDVYNNRICHDAGCSGGVCFDNTYTEEEKVEECGTSEYTGDSYCYNNDIYRDYITRTCSNSYCISPVSEKKTEDCEYGCTSGRCKIEVCSYGGCYYY